MSQLSQEGVTLRGDRLNGRSGNAGDWVDQALHFTGHSERGAHLDRGESAEM